MKKVTLLFAGAAIAVASMTGCIKREDTEVPAEGVKANGSARISGYVVANLSETEDSTTNKYWVFPKTITYAGANSYRWFRSSDSTLVTEAFTNRAEFAPAGTRVVATYATGNLDPNNVNNDTKTVSTSVKADGTYSLSIPCNGVGIAVTVRVEDFEADKTVFRDTDKIDRNGDVAGTVNDDEVTTIKAYYTTGNSGIITVVSGDDKVQDFTMGDTEK